MRGSKEIWLSDLDSFSALFSELWASAIFCFILVFTWTQNSASHLVFKIILKSISEQHKHLLESLREERWRASLCMFKATLCTPIRHFNLPSTTLLLSQWGFHILPASSFHLPIPSHLIAPFFPLQDSLLLKFLIPSLGRTI